MSVDTTPVETQNGDAEPNIDVPLSSTATESGIKKDLEFYFPDGSVYLRVNGNEFFVHRYKLLEFSELKSMLEPNPESHQVLELEGDENDFRNTFRVIYASFYHSSISDFESPMLSSALRLATRYNHSALRMFAINHLERLQLPPMDYLPLAREFAVVEWEKRALDHLAARDEPITVAEASLLGTESFVAMIVRREQRLVQAAHLKSLTATFVPPVPEAPPTSDVTIKDPEEDIIDLSDAPEDQSRNDDSMITDGPSTSEEPTPLDPKHPRTRLHLRQSLSGTPTLPSKQPAHQNGVSKKSGRKRK